MIFILSISHLKVLEEDKREDLLNEIMFQFEPERDQFKDKRAIVFP